MQLRDDGNGKLIKYPNMWNFLGGAVEGDETHTQAGVREIEEETSIQIDSSSLVNIFIYDHDQTVDDHIFACPVPEETTAKVHEGVAMEWLTFDEIVQLELGFEQERVLPALKKYLGLNS